MKEWNLFLWAVKSFVRVFIVLWGFAFAAEHTYNRLQPADQWVSTLSVESAKPVNKVEEDLYKLRSGKNQIDMRSVRVVHKPVEINFHDILYCKIDGKNWRFVSQQTVSVRYPATTYEGFQFIPAEAPKGVFRKSGQWGYRGEFPDDGYLPTVCKIVANMKWSPSPLVIKRSQIESSPFELIPNT